MKNLDNVTNVWGKVDERRHEVLEVSVQGMRNRWPLGFPLVKFRNAAGEEYAHSFKDDMQSNKVRVELNDRDVKRAGVCVMTVEWHDKGRVVASREYMGLIEGKKMEKPKYEVIGGEEDCGGGNGGGGGLPEGGEPYKQLVTDASGKTVWEDRLAWKEERLHFDLMGVYDFCKVSDEVSDTIPETIASIIAHADGTTENKDISVMLYSDNAYLYTEMLVAIAKQDNATINLSEDVSIVFPEKGVYMVRGVETGSYTAKATWDGQSYEWDGTFETIKPIDPEYLPDNIGGGVTSWNDLTDKPFGEVEEWVSFYSSLVRFTTQDNGYANAPVTDDFGRYGELTAEKEYKVIYDGTEYVLTAHDADRDFEGYEGEAMSYFVGLGDINLVETPFYIERYYMNNIANGHRIWNNGMPYVEVQICEKRAVSKPIPNEYLPVPMTVVYASGETLYSDKAFSSALTRTEASTIFEKQGIVLVISGTGTSAKMEIVQSYYYDVAPDAYVFATVSKTYNVT